MVFKRYIWLVIIILLGSYSYASESVDIQISNNNIVTEAITLRFTANESYDFVEFSTMDKPVTIIYDGKYSIRQEGNFYIITFEKEIVPGENTITFKLVYDAIIEESNKNKVFRTTFYPKEEMKVSVTLPMHHALSNKKPSVMPQPLDIKSDGQHIKLVWDFKDQEQVDIIVFYEGAAGFKFLPILIIVIVIIVLIFLGFYIYFKKKIRKDISETLSSEEIKVLDEARKGVIKQKEIARNLDFSKSKMSKVIRKLEEKGLVEKKPYFKTNIINLSKKIK